MPDTLSIDMPRILAAAQKASGLLRVLANENRMLLMCQLSQGEKSVGELEALLGIHQPTLSQQLGVLRNEGLVDTRRDGKWMYYRVAREEVLILLDALHGIYCKTAPGPGPAA